MKQPTTRYYVTVRTPEGVLLVNRMMCDCATRQEAIRAGKSAAVQNARFASPRLISLFVESLNITVVTDLGAR